MHGRLLNAINNAYARVKGGMSMWFEIYMGVCQSCAMLPWFYRVFMDGTLHEMYVLLNHGGTKLKLPQLLYADDAVMLATP